MAIKDKINSPLRTSQFRAAKYSHYIYFCFEYIFQLTCLWLFSCIWGIPFLYNDMCYNSPQLLKHGVLHDIKWDFCKTLFTRIFSRFIYIYIYIWPTVNIHSFTKNIHLIVLWQYIMIKVRITLQDAEDAFSISGILFCL